MNIKNIRHLYKKLFLAFVGALVTLLFLNCELSENLDFIELILNKEFPVSANSIRTSNNADLTFVSLRAAELRVGSSYGVQCFTEIPISCFKYNKNST